MQEILDEQDYDCGFMNDYGGGNISWWHDYIRAEIGRCNEHWRSIIESYASQPAIQTDKALRKLEMYGAMRLNQTKI